VSIDAFAESERGFEPSGKDLPWYAIRVQSRFEAVASLALRGKGYEEYLPRCRSRRNWSDRVKEVELPLFSGYLFCRLDITTRLLPILTIPGVICIVGAGRTPIAVPDREIEAIRTTLCSGLQVQPLPFIRQGCRVYLERGPLAGLEGIVTHGLNDKCRLVVSVHLLQRSLAVEIERDWARPVSGMSLTPLAMTKQPRTAHSNRLSA
jgi:transcriptional antiterminator NusG